MDEVDDRDAELLAESARWRVVQSPHGGLHVQIHRTVLNFAPDEFHRFVRLIGEAYVRLAVRSAVFEYAKP